MLINITLPLIFVLVMDEQPVAVNLVIPQEFEKYNLPTGEFKGIPHFFPKLENDEKREIVHYEQTIVIKDSGVRDDKVRRCEVLEVYKEGKAKEVLPQLEEILKIDATKIQIDRMVNLLEDCGSVDKNEEKPEPEPEPEPELESIMITAPKNRILPGILPGTKWCGLGDIAKSYHDLGIFRNVDKCCRSHDFCPIKVLAQRERYHLKNNALYTKSHCLCDDAFYNCLKKENSMAAKFIGQIFFNSIVRPMCIVGLPEIPQEEMQFTKLDKIW